MPSIQLVSRSIGQSIGKSSSLVWFVTVLMLSACVMTSKPAADATGVTGQTGGSLQPGESSTQPAAPMSTFTPAPESGCPVPPGSPPLPDLSAAFDWASELQAYLNQGGLVEPLADVLEAQSLPDGSTAGIVRRDLDADGFEDLTIVLYDLNDESRPSGSILVFRCDKNRYRLAYISSPGQNLGPPVLVSARDLNADGIPELLYTRESCGAHTCFQQVEVLRWERSGFLNIFSGRSDDLPSPSIELVGPTVDGSYRIEITAQGIASAGAGPYRRFTRIWGWSPEQSQFVVVNEQLAPPTFRIHMLHDADDAAAAGNLEAALVMYQRVREDGTLDDWIKDERGHAELAAFAAYRQMTLFVQLGRSEEARQALEFMQQAIPEGSPGYGMRLLAENFWETYSDTGDVVAACTSARRYAEQQAATVLEPLQYGYANRIYTPADVCLVEK
jgi:hypothetical protein